MVHEIATNINTELALTADVAQVALAVDPKNVVVEVPDGQDVASWIREVERVVLLVPEAEARVIIDRRSGTIVVSGDARISPVIISQKGLTVTISQQEDTAGIPSLQSFVAVDPSKAGSSHVGDLLEALKPLNVPIADRIEILTKITPTRQTSRRVDFRGDRLKVLAIDSITSGAGRESQEGKAGQLAETANMIAGQLFYGTLLKQLRSSELKGEYGHGGAW